MFSKALSFLTRAVFPQRCLQCNNVLSILEQSLCQFCLCSAPRLDSIAAQRAMLLSGTLPTRKTAAFRSALYFTGPVQIYCYSLKYGGNYSLGVVLGKHFLAPLIVSTLAGQRRPVIVTAMPVHLRRRFKRGYNQSEALARGALSGVREAGVDVYYEELLKKTAHRQSQINFDPFQRWNNTKGAFRTTKKSASRETRLSLSLTIRLQQVRLYCEQQRRYFTTTQRQKYTYLHWRKSFNDVQPPFSAISLLAFQSR